MAIAVVSWLSNSIFISIAIGAIIISYEYDIYKVWKEHYKLKSIFMDIKRKINGIEV